MTPVELDALADKVAERLNRPLISSALPAYIGDVLDTMKGCQVVDWLPWGAIGLQMEWKVNADRSLSLTMMEHNGSVFWRGIFQAVE